MGYLLRSAIIPNATEADFKDAKRQTNASITVPSILPVRADMSLQKVQSLKAQSADITRTAPLFNDPRYTSSTLAIPTDERTLHGLYRFFTETDPIVGAALKIHSEMPLADVRLGQCEDTGVQQHYEEMWDRINGNKLLGDVTAEHFEIGNVFPFGAWSETDYMWEQFAILNPDYVKVEATWVNQRPLVKLIPDEALKRIVQTQSPRFIYEQLPREIIQYVLFNREIPLDPNNVFHISHAKRPYEQRGKSIIKRILKVLMLEDRFNQANFALATRHAVPIEVVKVGDPASVEGNHYVVYKKNEKLNIITFDDIWDKFDGKVISTEGNKFVKFIGHHELYTQSLGKDGNRYWNKINSILRHETPDDMIKIKTSVGDAVSTASHGFVWINPYTGKFEKVSPEKLSDEYRPTLVTFDKFDYEIKANEVFDLSLNSDNSYLIGLWTADGSFPQKGHMLRVSNGDVSIGKYLVDRFAAKRYAGKNDITYHIVSSIGKHLLDYYGYDVSSISRPKTGLEKVPTEILFNSNKVVVGSFFAGVFDGDGTVQKNRSRVMVSCGASREYHHWLSLALLAQGIVSKVKFRRGYYELFVSGDKSVRKFIDLVYSYVKHTEKRSRLFSMRSDSVPHDEFKDCHMISDELMDTLFFDSDWRSSKGSLPSTVFKNHKRISRDIITEAAVESDEKVALTSHFGVGVHGIEYVKSDSKYVYDLMLEDDPHYYLVGGSGWLNTSNTGWVPDETELNAVREMMAARELDPNFSLIYHYGIDIVHYGSNGRMLPVGPELDRLYKLKFIGLGVHEQLLSGQGGSYSQAYINLEVQRQRYLNLQLKLETFMHQGVFKPVADLCGFYRIKQAVSGPAGVTSKKWGNVKEYKENLKKSFTSVRDFQDNQEFKNFLDRKAEEDQAMSNKQLREYIYPKLDWGSLSAASDENLKNYVKWLKDKAPHLIDDATLSRLARLDRDTQEKAYIEDLKRKRTRYQTVSKLGLLPFMDQPKGKGGAGGGPIDLGGIGDIGVGGGGEIPGLEGEPGAIGGEPALPTGVGGPPEAAGGGMPAPAGVASSLEFEEGIRADVAGDDITIANENKSLLKAKSTEDKAVLKVVDG